MAGEWIKVEASTADKPEVSRIARLLKIPHDAVFGKLVRLWAWIDTNSVDGVVDGVVDADIDRLCHCDGFAAAVAAVGWLVIDADAERMTLPNFDRHNGETAKQRAMKNRRQAKWRAGVDEVVDVAASTKASTREEKRREEDKEQKQELSAQPAASRFSEWWSAWPTAKKVGRKKAEQLWGRRKLDAIADRLVADVLHRVAHDDGWQRGYAPDPCTYINQDRWEDALRPAPTGSTPTAPASKTLNAIQALEGMKHGLAQDRISDRVPEAALLELGSDAGD